MESQQLNEQPDHYEEYFINEWILVKYPTGPTKKARAFFKVGEKRLFNFGTFITGVLFGIFICGVAIFHFLVATKSKGGIDDDFALDSKTASAETGVDLPLGFKQQDMDKLNAIIDYLDDVSSPLKSLGVILQKIHVNKDAENNAIDAKMKTIVDLVSLSKLEKDHQDNIAELKDHAKQIKFLSSFLNELTKTVSSFSKDLGKLSSTAKSNMHRNSVIETKEDMIVNAWWQSLQIAMDHLSSDQEELATMVSDQLQNVSQQLQEEIGLIEKRLNSEGNRYINALRENIQMFEAKLRDRDKYKEKMRTASITGTAASLLTSASEQHQKRQGKLKQAEEALVLQTRRLYEAQRDFYLLLPRIASDVQLTVLKSIIETQSQLMKLADGIERAQGNSRSVCRRLRTQLTNAAGSLVQMINSESRLLPDQATNTAEGDSVVGNSSLALEIMRQRQQDRRRGHSVQGFEISLQRVLEGLLLQAQARKSHDNDALDDQQGKLDMFAETTACLAANNPALLPSLPSHFGTHAIGLETCVWFNAFCGRVYRDMAESAYFNAWFRAKLAAMLNKGKRPGYVDAFEVSSVKFGDQPPLLLNVKWFPPPPKRKKRFGGASSAGTSTKGHASNAEDQNSDDSDGEEVKLSPDKDAEIDGDNDGENDGDPISPSDNEYSDDNCHYYAACNADIVFRSGLQFTVSTRFWLNWPRDRYASVPILIHLDLSELQGRVRFGVNRSHSFLSFLKDPLTRISVRSEVGSDRLKLRDIPQVSDYIVRKLKSFIHRKVVHPHAHKFRLIWPRNWWPEGTENLFTSTTSVPTSDGSTPLAEASSEVAADAAKKVPVEMAVQTEIMALDASQGDLEDMLMRETFVNASYASLGLGNVSVHQHNSVSGMSPEQQKAGSRRPSVAPAATGTASVPAEGNQSQRLGLERSRSMSLNQSSPSSSISTTNKNNNNTNNSSSSKNNNNNNNNNNIVGISNSCNTLGPSTETAVQITAERVDTATVTSITVSTTTPSSSVKNISPQQQQERLWCNHLRHIANRLQQQWNLHQYDEAIHAAEDDHLTPRLAATSDEMDDDRLTMSQIQPAPTPIQSPLEDRYVAQHMRMFYRKFQDHRCGMSVSDVFLLDNDHEDSVSHADSSGGYPLFHHQLLLHPNRRPRAMSLSEYRPEVLSVLLEDVLEHRDLQVPAASNNSNSPYDATRFDQLEQSGNTDTGFVGDDIDRNRGKLLVGFRRARRPAHASNHSASNANTGHRRPCGQFSRDPAGAASSLSSNRQRNTTGNGAGTGRVRQRTSTVAGAEYMYQPRLFESSSTSATAGQLLKLPTQPQSAPRPTGQQRASRRPSAVWEQDDEDSSHLEGDSLDSAARWLKSRGKEGMEKAKAKFREFTSKHFSGGAESNSTHGNNSQASSGGSSTNLSSSPSMLSKLERRLSGKGDMFSSSSSNHGHSGGSGAPLQSQSDREALTTTNNGGSSGGSDAAKKSLVSLFRDKDSSSAAPAEDTAGSNSSTSKVNSMFSKALSSVRQHIQETRNSHFDSSQS